MSLAPLAILVAVAVTLTFEGLLYGGSLASDLPQLPSFPNFATCPSGGGVLDANGPVATIACYLGDTFLLIGAFGLSVVDGAILVADLASFNVPGAPDYVRLLFTFVVGGAILLGVAGMLRGYGSRST
ncbi:MAG: hypothetical protein ACYDDF_05300 [Thermoplasmatota archaeon]